MQINIIGINEHMKNQISYLSNQRWKIGISVLPKHIFFKASLTPDITYFPPYYQDACCIQEQNEISPCPQQTGKTKWALLIYMTFQLQAGKDKAKQMLGTARSHYSSEKKRL
jgi:hypothetical protein